MAKYDAAQIDKMKVSGEAMPDGSYPIADGEDLANAIHAVGRGGADHDAIRRHIIKRAKALGLMDDIPDNWNPDGSLMMGASASLPRDNLIRAMLAPGAVDASADGRTLYGHFAVFDTPTEINSMYEGRFMEQIAPGAFARTIAKQGDRVKVLYDHGQDPSIGNKPLGVTRSLREDAKGVAFEVGLFDNTSYVADLLPGLRAGAYGSSFRFRVVNDSIDENPPEAAWNPNGLPVRTLLDVDLYEFGPVTFPAYADATAGVRSLTDTFADRLLRDPLFLARFTERAGRQGVEFIEAIRDVSAAPRVEEAVSGVTSGSADEDNDSKARRLAAHQQATSGFLRSIDRYQENSNAR